MGYIREEAARGRTFVLTTQILSEAEELCDDILIINQGRQVARGDLNALKMLSEGMKEVSLTFDQLPEGIEADLERLNPLHLHVNQNTVEICLQMPEAQVLELISGLSRRGRVLRMEVAGASLEDIFVQLMQPGKQNATTDEHG
jgi:ABC-2 type transport system ATP-binding protein